MHNREGLVCGGDAGNTAGAILEISCPGSCRSGCSRTPWRGLSSSRRRRTKPDRNRSRIRRPATRPPPPQAADAAAPYRPPGPACRTRTYPSTTARARLPGRTKPPSLTRGFPRNAVRTARATDRSAERFFPDERESAARPQLFIRFVGRLETRTLGPGVIAMQDYSGYGQPPAGDYGPTMPMPPMPPRPPRRCVGALSYLLVALAAGALGAGSVVALYHPASNNSSSQAAPQPSSSAVNPAPLPTGAIPLPSAARPSASAGEQAIVNKVAPGLVLINTTLQYSNEAAAATGMVINSDGLVLTNNHVIEDSTSITARTANGHQYHAKVLGYDVTGD